MIELYFIDSAHIKFSTTVLSIVIYSKNMYNSFPYLYNIKNTTEFINSYVQQKKMNNLIIHKYIHIYHKNPFGNTSLFNNFLFKILKKIADENIIIRKNSLLYVQLLYQLKMEISLILIVTLHRIKNKNYHIVMVLNHLQL